MRNEKSFGAWINRSCSTNSERGHLAAPPPAVREASESAKKVAVKKLAVQINPSNALAALPPAVREGFRLLGTMLQSPRLRRRSDRHRHSKSFDFGNVFDQGGDN
jgi:hypothetical protein